jgi:hypothetical protein
LEGSSCATLDEIDLVLLPFALLLVALPTAMAQTVTRVMVVADHSDAGSNC